MFHRLGLAGGLRRAHEGDVKEAKAYMIQKHHHGHNHTSEDEDMAQWDGEAWGMQQVEQYIRDKPGRCIILVRGFVVDATSYLKEHVCLFCFRDYILG